MADLEFESSHLIKTITLRNFDILLIFTNLKTAIWGLTETLEKMTKRSWLCETGCLSWIGLHCKPTGAVVARSLEPLWQGHWNHHSTALEPLWQGHWNHHGKGFDLLWQGHWNHLGKGFGAVVARAFEPSLWQ